MKEQQYQTPEQENMKACEPAPAYAATVDLTAKVAVTDYADAEDDVCYDYPYAPSFEEVCEQLEDSFAHMDDPSYWIPAEEAEALLLKEYPWLKS